jgi:hypothetical protein
VSYRFLIMLLIGCSSQESHWQSVSLRLNGELVALRPTAGAISANASNNDVATVRALVAMCTSVDSSLKRITSLYTELHELDDEPGGPHSYMTNVPDNARWLVEHRNGICDGDDWRCRDWCVERWKALATSVRELDAHASTHGAHLERLD